MLYVYRDGHPLTQKQIIRLAGRLAARDEPAEVLVSFENFHVAICYLYNFFVRKMQVGISFEKKIKCIHFDNCFNSTIIF